MKKMSKKTLWRSIVVMILALLISLAGFVFTSINQIQEENENNLRLAAHIISGTVTNSLIKPITAAKVMSEDVNLKQYLKTAGNDPEGVEEGMKKYLTSLRDGLGYKMMFAVCDTSGAYYTCDGISSYIDKNYNGNSAWYGAFISSGKDWDLDVDVEESTGWALSVFINQSVKDDQNHLIGICGMGVEMTQLQSLIEQYERIYQVKIDITDETGLIQIDTDEEKIEKDSIELPDVTQISDGEYYYDKQDSGDRVIAYMEDVDMYLVVAETQNTNDSLLTNLRIPFICTSVGILMVVGLFVIEQRKEK